MSGYWNPITPINIPNNTVTINPTPPADPLTRIASALERIAFQFEQYNAKHSVTTTVKTKPRPRVKRRA